MQRGHVLDVLWRRAVGQGGVGRRGKRISRVRAYLTVITIRLECHCIVSAIRLCYRKLKRSVAGRVYSHQPFSNNKLAR